MVLIGHGDCHFGVVCAVVGKTWLAYSRPCALIHTQVLENFVLLFGTPNQWRVPGAISKFPRLALECFAGFRPAWAASTSLVSL